jgi:RNA polymerase sigma-70 factor (ECF subfamily)
MRSDVDREIGGQLYADDGAGVASGSAVAIAGPPTLRMEFGSHLEANYPRLVAQLSMITLDVAQAYKLADDAYARAWQRWAVVRELPDPTSWIRQTAVRASSRKRPMLQFRRKRAIPDNVFEQPANASVYSALGQLKPYIRRPLVLADVAHLPIEEVARVEGIVVILAESRVTRGREELSMALQTDPGVEVGAATAWEQM